MMLVDGIGAIYRSAASRPLVRSAEQSAAARGAKVALLCALSSESNLQAIRGALYAETSLCWAGASKKLRPHMSYILEKVTPT